MEAKIILLVGVFFSFFLLLLNYTSRWAEADIIEDGGWRLSPNPLDLVLFERGGCVHTSIFVSGGLGNQME